MIHSLRPSLAIAALAACSAAPQPGSTGVQAPAPLQPIPSARQRAWHAREYYAFVHFNMDTFTGREWGTGEEDPDTFQPSALDCRQWAQVARQAGMTGIILTAKHHDGFCLWPSAFSEHDVESSSWRDGAGDVLAELSAACREAGLGFGVYLSPWDRNHPRYGQGEAYDDVFVGQLEELLTRYGPVFEVWWDGACGEGPSGKRQEYDWPRYRETVRRLQPQAVMFSDVGPDVRWIGNERGLAGETCWGMLSPAGFEPGAGAPASDVLNAGQEDGTHWIPGECDVSIRPGWYYKPEQDGQVKSLEELLEIWYGSVGRNANLLLNLPVDKRGLVHENDAQRLLELRAALDAIFETDLARTAQASSLHERGGSARFAAARANDGDAATFWACEDGVTSAALTLRWPAPTLVDHAVLGEALELGQRVRSFSIAARVGGEEREVARGTTIGRKRIVRFAAVEAEELTLRVEDARACPALATFEVYCAPPRVEIVPRDRVFLDATKAALVADQPGCEVRYTTDGSVPTLDSPLAQGSLLITQSTELTALAFRNGRPGLLPARERFIGYTAGTLLPGLHFLRAPDPGLEVDLRRGAWQSLADLAHVEPLATTDVAGIDLEQRPRDEHFAMVFRGLLQAPLSGIYEFELASDDGSRLWIDGQLVVDNDGLHGLLARQGAIGLAAGFHRLRLEYFNASGSRALALSWSGPGFEPEPVPSEALFH